MARGLSLRRLNADKKTISLVCADQVSTRIFQGSLSERISLIRPWRGLKNPCSRRWLGANPSEKQVNEIHLSEGCRSIQPSSPQLFRYINVVSEKSPCSEARVGVDPLGQWIALIYSSRGWRRRLPLQQLLSASFCTIARQQQRPKKRINVVFSNQLRGRLRPQGLLPEGEREEDTIECLNS